MFSIVTVASSTNIPTASAGPPRVITLIVWPSAERAISELNTARGIDTVIMSVERQEPRNTKIMKPVKAAAVKPSRTTAVTEALTKPDWSPTYFKVTPEGKAARITGRRSFTPEMISKVDAEPIFSTDIRTPLRPSSCTTLVCGGEPLWAGATSRMSATTRFHTHTATL